MLIAFFKGWEKKNCFAGKNCQKKKHSFFLRLEKEAGLGKFKKKLCESFLLMLYV
jgi:hypothetical protein